MYCFRLHNSVCVRLLTILQGGMDMTVRAVCLKDSVEGVVVHADSKPVVFPHTGEIALPTVRGSDLGVALVDIPRHTIREIVLSQ